MLLFYYYFYYYCDARYTRLTKTSLDLLQSVQNEADNKMNNLSFPLHFTVMHIQVKTHQGLR